MLYHRHPLTAEEALHLACARALRLSDAATLRDLLRRTNKVRRYQGDSQLRLVRVGSKDPVLYRVDGYDDVYLRYE